MNGIQRVFAVSASDRATALLSLPPPAEFTKLAICFACFRGEQGGAPIWLIS